ncbi:MAG: FlgD immunoglobulin-like domain containing protein [Ignavibacteria bacterium]
MKKFLLLFLNLLIFITFIHPQKIREVPLVEEAASIKLDINLNKEFKIFASAFFESFEDPIFPPAGWTDFIGGGSGWTREASGTILPGWGSGEISTPVGGGNFVAYCTYSIDPPFNDQWLISPQVLDIQPQDTLFFWLQNQADVIDTVDILYSFNGTNFTRIGRVTYNETSDPNWGFWFVRIGAAIAPGSNVFFAFREHIADNSFDGGPISLDLIYISGRFNYPSNISINKSFTFADATQQTSYRMIGLPGNTNFSMASKISGTPKQDWTAFYDNGADENFLTEFNNQALFNFNPGKGFWVLSKNPINMSEPAVNSVALVSGTFAISLHAGWNIISNPFERGVDWADVQNINGITQPIYDFNGTYSPAATMETYKGYYFFNADNRGTLSIPYNPGGVLGKNSNAINSPDNSAGLKISLILNDQEKSSAVVSMNPDSKDGYDKYDIFAPPGHFEEAKVCFYNDLLPSYKYLMTDSRNEIGEGQSYNLKIKNSSGIMCSIYVEGLENFGSNEIYLFDLRSKKSYNLKMQSKIEISRLHENNDLRLLIGSKDYIDKTKISELPTEYKLYQNYPNPFSQNYPNSFNPSTIISFDLPRNQNIKLVIYNMLGERIKTIFSGYLEAGKHEFAWDGTNDSNSGAASGAYIYSLEGPEIRIAKKMILNR